MGEQYTDYLERVIDELQEQLNAKHSVVIGRSNVEVAKQICDLRYDGLSDLLNEMVLKLHSDAGADFRRNRPQLASHLVMAAVNLSKAQAEIRKAWEICKPHMKQET